MTPKFKKALNYTLPGIAFILIALVYRSTLAPTVTPIDCGELAAVQSIAGVAHPTGYPLFTMLGYSFLRIPFFHSVIYQLNWLCLFWCLCGLLIFYRTALLISMEFVSGSERIDPHNTGINWRGIFSALTGTFFLAFCFTFWMQSTSVEVYSLHIFLVLLVLYFTCRAFLSDVFQLKMWVFTAIALAMAFCNHMSVLMVLPAVLYFYILDMKRSTHRIRHTFICFTLFLIVLSAVYLYLPLRARQTPALNWGNPQTWPDFWRHISGRQYQVWMFSSFQTAVQHFKHFFNKLPYELTWPGLLLASAGLFTSILKYRKLAVFLVLLFSSTVIYAVQYDINDLDAYFLLAYMTAGFCMVVAVSKWLYFFRSNAVISVMSVTIILAGVTLCYHSHRRDVDQSDVFVFADYTRQALNSLPQDALLLSYQWDCLISPACYFQNVENLRKDVAVVDKELLRRSWYFSQLDTQVPEITSRIKPEVHAFLTALEPFERGEPYNAERLEFHFQKMISRIMVT